MIYLPVLSNFGDTAIIEKLMFFVEKDLWCRIEYENAKDDRLVGLFCPWRNKITLISRDVFVFLHELGHAIQKSTKYYRKLTSVDYLTGEIVAEAYAYWFISQEIEASLETAKIWYRDNRSYYINYYKADKNAKINWENAHKLLKELAEIKLTKKIAKILSN